MTIDLNGKSYTLEELANTTPTTIFERDTILFIRKWLDGDEAMDITTSGSTGKPKLIKIPRSKMVLSARNTIDALKLPVGGKVLLCLGTKHIAGQMMLVRAIVNQMNVIAIEPSSNPLNGLDKDLSFSLSAMVPMQMKSIVQNPLQFAQLDSFHSILLGGAPISQSLESSLQKSKSSIYATYGMTETVSHIALRKVNPPNKSELFKTIGGVSLGQDNRNCLTIKGEITDNQELVTNDIVDLIDDQHFAWIGRYDNVINTGGIKVQSETIEKTIASLLLDQKINNRFFCYGLPDKVLGERVVLVIEGGIDTDKDKILLEIKSSVPQFHEPKEIYIVDRFSETETKKVNRKLTIETVIASLPSA